MTFAETTPAPALSPRLPTETGSRRPPVREAGPDPIDVFVGLRIRIRRTEATRTHPGPAPDAAQTIATSARGLTPLPTGDNTGDLHD